MTDLLLSLTIALCAGIGVWTIVRRLEDWLAAE